MILEIGEDCRTDVEALKLPRTIAECEPRQNLNTNGVSATAIAIISRSSGMPIRR